MVTAADPLPEVAPSQEQYREVVASEVEASEVLLPEQVLAVPLSEELLEAQLETPPIPAFPAGKDDLLHRRNQTAQVLNLSEVVLLAKVVKSEGSLPLPEVVASPDQKDELQEESQDRLPAALPEELPEEQLETPPIPARHVGIQYAHLHHSMGNHFLLAYVALKK